MITEKHFSLGHSQFWSTVMPLGEEYMRLLNGSLVAFLPPLESDSAPSDRGVINELAMRVFCWAWSNHERSRAVAAGTLAQLHDEARAQLAQMRHFGRVGPASLGDRALEEAVAIAERIEIFDAQRLGRIDALRPAFCGCGWVDACFGDLLSGGALVEVKAGDRGFLATDLRQVMTYCALNFASKEYDVHSIVLVNPRHGRYFEAPLEVVCRAAAGRSAIDVLSRIVDYISTPLSGFMPND